MMMPAVLASVACGVVLSPENPEVVLPGSGYWVDSDTKNLVVHNSTVHGKHLELKQELKSSESTSLLIGDYTFLSSNHSAAEGYDILFAEEVSVDASKATVTTLVTEVWDTEPKALVRGHEGVVLELADNAELSGGKLGKFGLQGSTIVVDGKEKLARGVDVLKIGSGQRAVLRDMEAHVEYALDMDGATLVLANTSLSLGQGADKTTNAEMIVNNIRGEKELIVVHVGAAAQQKLNLAKRPVENGTIQGTGALKNVCMQGGVLKVGAVPGVQRGVLAIENVQCKVSEKLMISPEWNFTLGTDANYDFTGSNAESGGRFSQLKVVGHANRGEMVTITIDYEDAQGATNKNALNNKFKEGATITLIDTTAGSVSGTYFLDPSQLPELDDGLQWYVDDLFHDGALKVASDLAVGISELSGDFLIPANEVPVVVQNNQIADSRRLADTMTVAAETTGHFGRMALSHVDDWRKWDSNAWGSAYYGNLNRDTYDSTGWGYAVGMDTRVKKYNAIVGVALGSTRGKVKPESGNFTYTGGKIDQDGVQLGLYGRICQLDSGFDEKSVNVDAYLSYGKYDCKSRRTAKGNGETLTSCWDENSWAMGVTVSRHYQWRHGVVLTPFAGLEYTMAEMDGLREMGYTAVDYSCDRAYRNLALRMGVRAHRHLALRNGQMLIPYAGASIELDLLRRNGKVSSVTELGKVSASGENPGRAALQMNVGSD